MNWLYTHLSNDNSEIIGAKTLFFHQLESLLRVPRGA